MEADFHHIKKDLKIQIHLNFVFNNNSEYKLNSDVKQKLGLVFCIFEFVILLFGLYRLYLTNAS